MPFCVSSDHDDSESEGERSCCMLGRDGNGMEDLRFFLSLCRPAVTAGLFSVCQHRSAAGLVNKTKQLRRQVSNLSIFCHQVC